MGGGFFMALLPEGIASPSFSDFPCLPPSEPPLFSFYKYSTLMYVGCVFCERLLGVREGKGYSGVSFGLICGSSGPHHQDSGEARIRESTAGVSRKPSSDGKARGCSSKHLCGLTAWDT